MPPFLTTDCSYCSTPAISAIRCADCGEAICDTCRDEFARLCDGCGELVCNEHLKMLNGSLLCEKCRAYQEAEEQAAARAVLNRERLTRKAADTGDNKDLKNAMKARAS